MKDGRASWTAQLVTFFRAINDGLPESERVCHDPLAHEFLNWSWRLVGGSPVRSRVARRYVETHSQAATYTYIIARTRFIDELLADQIERGLAQLVLMGAGFDTRAYRFGELVGRVKVFEVDHPSTQELKVKRLERAFGAVPDHVVYVPVDFESELVEQKLLREGYDPGSRTFFIWEGVVSYLTPCAVDEMLASWPQTSARAARSLLLTSRSLQ